jgi:hypothetical protein
MPRYPKPPRENERRAVLSALSGAPKAQAARNAGIDRKHLHKLLKESTEPKELEFRREVQRLWGRIDER